jgi:hypothetical protein
MLNCISSRPSVVKQHRVLLRVTDPAATGGTQNAPPGTWRRWGVWNRSRVRGGRATLRRALLPLEPCTIHFVERLIRQHARPAPFGFLRLGSHVAMISVTPLLGANHRRTGSVPEHAGRRAPARDVLARARASCAVELGGAMSRHEQVCWWKFNCRDEKSRRRWSPNATASGLAGAHANTRSALTREHRDATPRANIVAAAATGCQEGDARRAGRRLRESRYMQSRVE